MYKILWRVLRKKLLPYFRAEQNAPVTHKDLSYAFTDYEGKRYFRFPDPLNLPLPRHNKQSEYLMWMSARLTSENLTLLVDKGIELIEKGIKQGKNASAVAAILHQIKDRESKIVPHELVLNFLAVHYVREDEAVEEFNNEIQLQKVNAFLEDSKLANNFFLTLPEWKKFTSITSLSRDDWERYLAESIQENEILQKSLEIYSSLTPSSTKGKATKPST